MRRLSAISYQLSAQMICAVYVLAGQVGAEPARRGAEAGYLEELERRGLVDKSLATPDRLAAEVRSANEDLMAGRAMAAAARLYPIVEGPRFQDLSSSEDFQDAEYRLGVALAKGGATQAARRYFDRALERGPKAPFYQGALRAYVHVCLGDRVVPACLAALARLPEPLT